MNMNEQEEIIRHLESLITSEEAGASVLAEALEFLRIYAGDKSSFYKKLEPLIAWNSDKQLKEMVAKILKGYINHLKSGFANGITIERKAQIDVVSDFLEQANNLLQSKKVHPAAPTVLIGASLEEFLRNWVEEQNISLGNLKPGMDNYSKLLKEKDLITKQDFKDLTSWAGLRNHAAHGEWSEVEDKRRVKLMLEGVNLFMRKYGTEK
ncbi:hypothetical protein [Tenacibaculum geojense]|uniref:RiboL-PSP-HEPN domain-containing protein n=1 Tax=Tenacibaculum geojense TaxID=915352 RepID=A0ABW3JQP5_9FLAO